MTERKKVSLHRNPAITVAICTFNRCESLRVTLDSLASQTGVELSSVDVLIIDNNSTDDTELVVDAFADRLPIRRVVELRQGLSHARNRSVSEFRGDVLLFADDDVRLGQTWLAAFKEAIRRFPDAEYFGGRIIPEWSGSRPRWVRDACVHLIDGVLVWFDHGQITRLFENGETAPFGASFGITRSLLDRLGGFRLDLGVGGQGLGRGEETEFLLRARASGASGVYVGEALSFHRVDRRRLTLGALYRHGKACGRSQNAILETPRRGTETAAAWFLARGLFQLAKGRGDRFRQCIINAGIEIGTRQSSGSSGLSSRRRA